MPNGKTELTTRRAVMRGAGTLVVGAGAGALGLAACGATGTGSGGTGETIAPAEIFFTLPGSAGLEQDLYNGFINDFHARQSKIKVRHTFEPVFGDYPAKLRALLASDTWPDLAHQHLSVVQDFSQ